MLAPPSKLAAVLWVDQTRVVVWLCLQTLLAGTPVFQADIVEIWAVGRAPEATHDFPEYREY